MSFILQDTSKLKKTDKRETFQVIFKEFITSSAWNNIDYQPYLRLQTLKFKFLENKAFLFDF